MDGGDDIVVLLTGLRWATECDCMMVLGRFWFSIRDVGRGEPSVLLRNRWFAADLFFFSESSLCSVTPLKSLVWIKEAIYAAFETWNDFATASSIS